MADPFDLERFVRAQDPLIADVRRELRAGRKRTHWMWQYFGGEPDPLTAELLAGG